LTIKGIHATFRLDTTLKIRKERTIDMNIALFNPAYPYGKPQAYLPGGLANLLSRLLAAGVDGSLTDLNFASFTDETVGVRLSACQAIGFSVLGAPYIPAVIGYIRQLRELGYLQPILVGGEGISRVAQADFQAWFGDLPDVRQIRHDLDLQQSLGIRLGSLPAESVTSMVPALELLTLEERTRYFTGELCLQLSRGCAFSCSFCGADRGKKETYRTLDTLEREVDFICSHLQAISHPRLEVYVSNLDAFQTPELLEQSLAVIWQSASRHGITTAIRGLATSKCTFRAVENDPGLLGRLYGYGLRTVAFGADGASEATWKAQNKRHNVMNELLRSILAVRKAGIGVEILMVIGFPGEKLKDMLLNFWFSIGQAFGGAVVRPYLAKEYIPTGNWKDDDPLVLAFRKDPNLLICLDFAALGSRWTHPDPLQRWLSNATYLLIIGLLTPFGRCVTSPLLAVPPGGWGRRAALAVNRMVPFDR
jgi:hypothetical protein